MLVDLSEELKEATWINIPSGDEIFEIAALPDNWFALRHKAPNAGTVNVYAFQAKLRFAIAAGNIGTLYKVCPVRAGYVDIANPHVKYIAKIPKNPATTKDALELTAREAHYLNKKSIFTLPVIVSHCGPIIITTNINGIDLCTNDENGTETLNPIIQQLSLKERLSLLSSIALSFSIVHNRTPSTGAAVFHQDIKGANIRVGLRLEKKPKTVSGKSGKVKDQTKPAEIRDGKIFIEPGYELFYDIRPIDFGYAERRDNDNLAPPFESAGTLCYAAPERWEQHVGGLKSDVYSLTAIFIFMLGGENPLLDKLFGWEKPQVKLKKPFRIKNICHDFPDFTLGTNYNKSYLIEIITRFLNLMQHVNYSTRVDIDTVLRFTVVLAKFHNELPLLEEARETKDAEKIEIQEAYLTSYMAELEALADNKLLIYASTCADNITSRALLKYGYKIEYSPEENVTNDVSKKINHSKQLIENLSTYIVKRWNKSLPSDKYHRITKDDVKNLDFNDLTLQLPEHYNHCWSSFFGGHSSREKITVALKLIAHLKNELNPSKEQSVKFDDREKQILMSSELGEILNSHELPSFLKTRKLI